MALKLKIEKLDIDTNLRVVIMLIQDNNILFMLILFLIAGYSYLTYEHGI